MEMDQAMRRRAPRPPAMADLPILKSSMTRPSGANFTGNLREHARLCRGSIAELMNFVRDKTPTLGGREILNSLERTSDLPSP